VYSVLIVDDEPGIVKGLERMIHQGLPDCSVTNRAANGAQGFDLATRFHTDIVLTDVRMPKEDGLGMIRRLKEAGSLAAFIILSGYAEFEYAKKAMSFGVRHYLEKPVREEELYGAFREVCAGIRAVGDAGPAGKDARQDTVSEIRGYLAEHFAEEVSLAELSRRFFLHPVYLSQLFKEKTGETYLNFLIGLRVDAAKGLLSRTDLKIYQVSEQVGYKDTKYFSHLFEKHTGCKPSDFKKAADAGGTANFS
jgi:YesN/AraC family two-component response regulator